MVKIVIKLNIRASYRSDHPVIELQFFLNKFSLGKGVWKFNNSLLTHSEYLELVNYMMEDQTINSAIPV